MKSLVRLICFSLLILADILHSCKKEVVPTLTTATVTNITGTTATSGGTITDEGSGTVVERGICWSKNITPTISDNKTSDGAGAGTFTSNMADLDAATTYYVRAYGTNSAGTGYGMAISFTTLGQAPTATTQSATNVNTTSATLNGVVNGNYLSTTVTFEYGTTTSYGQTVNAAQNPVIGNSNTNVTADISGLTTGITYHFRVKTVNSLGTTNGNDMFFTTLGKAPSGATSHATNITATSATLNGRINANFLSTAITFEYGITTSYGQSVTAGQSPITGNIFTNVSADIYGLTSGTTYHFRVKAVNSVGTTYGDDMSFTTTLTDGSGFAYNFVTIGTQVWMKENLRTTKYSNGENISSGIYVPNDVGSNATTYGRLYTWNVLVDNRNICPTGWHVPSEAEWNILLSCVTSPAELKESGTEHWLTPNTGATNSVGFTALPAGYFDFVTFGFRSEAAFWFSNELAADAGRGFKLYYNNSPTTGDYVNVLKIAALSVRCLKN